MIGQQLNILGLHRTLSLWNDLIKGLTRINFNPIPFPALSILISYLFLDTSIILIPKFHLSSIIESSHLLPLTHHAAFTEYHTIYKTYIYHVCVKQVRITMEAS